MNLFALISTGKHLQDLCTLFFKDGSIQLNLWSGSANYNTAVNVGEFSCDVQRGSVAYRLMIFSKHSLPGIGMKKKGDWRDEYTSGFSDRVSNPQGEEWRLAIRTIPCRVYPIGYR